MCVKNIIEISACVWIFIRPPHTNRQTNIQNKYPYVHLSLYIEIAQQCFFSWLGRSSLVFQFRSHKVPLIYLDHSTTLDIKLVKYKGKRTFIRVSFYKFFFTRILILNLLFLFHLIQTTVKKVVFPFEFMSPSKILKPSNFLLHFGWTFILARWMTLQG